MRWFSISVSFPQKTLRNPLTIDSGSAILLLKFHKSDDEDGQEAGFSESRRLVRADSEASI